MTEVQIPSVPITSPLQLLTLPLDIVNQVQSEMMLATIRAMSGDADGGDTGSADNTTASDQPQALSEPNTYINRRDNITINRSEKILDEQTPGYLDEIVIRSTSDFSVEVLIDGNLFIHESMTDLIDMSADVSSIVAIHDGTNYVFSISDITYNEIMIRPFLSGSGTFNIFKKLTRGQNAN